MWLAGQTKAKQPRLIHDTENIVLLVGAVYKCSENHTVYSTDPRFMKRLNSLHLPFVLLHRTGFTRTLIHCIISLAQEGLPLAAIARHIQTIRREHVAEITLNLITEYEQHTGCRMNGKQSLIMDITTSAAHLIEPLPTNDVIARCFIIAFQRNEMFYIKQMEEVKVKRCIRLDHTFKVASNIGYLRYDGKWVTQYGSILVVLNENGQVVAWQFTNSTSLDELLVLLSNVEKQIDIPEHGPLTIYVDNCCQVRKKLQQIFGADTIVKLDTFHAVQRITRAMSKRHPFFYSCMSDLRMVFRLPTDIGNKRTMNSPDNNVMLTNLETFVQKWKDAEHDGKKIITEKVMHQISALKVHIRRGCLSNIEPGGGTNYNEALHRHINPHFNHAGRMGLPLAYALLTIILYRYNCKKTSSANTLMQAVAVKLGARNTDSTIPTFGIMGNGLNKDNSVEENVEGEMATDEGPSIISIVDIDCLLRKALASADVAESMCRMIGNSPTFSYQLIPFMSDVPSLYFHPFGSMQTNEELLHSKQIFLIRVA